MIDRANAGAGDSGRGILLASAPGRLDVMGGIGDYSGSMVLEMPIRERTNVFIADREDTVVRVMSMTVREEGGVPEFSADLRDFERVREPGGYEWARRKLGDIPGGDWASYAFGCYLVLMREKGLKLRGSDLFVTSKVPVGKGVSSSAALEIASMNAILAANGAELDPAEIPVLAQMVENHVAGAPCGLMDQLTSHFGEKDKLLPILCQPGEVRPSVPVPEGLAFVGIDSGVRHAVGGSSYTDTRTAAFMGLSILLTRLGAERKALDRARETGSLEGLPHGGYLANIPPSALMAMEPLPGRMEGCAFLDQYGGTLDPITEPKPGVEYRVQAAALHPVEEHRRVLIFMHLLESLNRPGLEGIPRREILDLLGELMLQAHASYSRCGLGCAETDAIVKAAMEPAGGNGIYGAKITGGGSGGAVCLLCDARGVENARALARDLEEQTGRPMFFFEGGSDGAVHTPLERATFQSMMGG